MALLQSTEYRHYRNAVIFSLLLALLAGAFLLSYGKEGSFLVINEHNARPFDYVFRFWTYLGDGIIWVPLFAFAIFWRRDYLVAVVASLIICTILTHLLKRVVFPHDFRPVVVLAGKVRTIPGVYMNRSNSFPSGHTSTAFTLALLLAAIVRRNFWVYFFPLVAFFVGYSRVYLAQHFVTDVFAGILVGVVSSYGSLVVHERYRKRVQAPRLDEPLEEGGGPAG